MIAQIINKNQIIVNDLSQFDPEAIFHSGQVFRYFLIENGYLVISGDKWAKLIPHANKVIIETCDANYFWKYFDLDTDYQKIKEQLYYPKLQNAIRYGGGIRILRANFIEIVISFIISANNNIKRFTKTLNDLADKYGKVLIDNYHAFPSLTQLANLTEIDFQNLGCGYRSKYLVQTISQLQTLNFSQLNQIPSDKLQQQLLQLSGVGLKVANCILLFAFHRLEIAPVDTWIRKAIEQLSPDEQNHILHGTYAGIAQQYMFYYLQHLHGEVL